MKITYQIIILILTCSAAYAEPMMAKSINLQAESRDDGGYILTLTGSVRILRPITAEGMFPKQQIYNQITLKGRGEEWSYRNQPGYFYSYPRDIEAPMKPWDIGYAWVDKSREKIYLNFYWVKSPDSLVESEINGSYNLNPGAKKPLE